MFHNELFLDLQNYLKYYFKNEAITILDLGCGSARHIASALAQFPVKNYVGYDLSETALNHARNNLVALQCSFELIQADLLSGLKERNSAYDIVFSGFACHHLNETEKNQFFQMAYRCLKAKGVLVLIDVVRAENESLHVYLERYCNWLRSNWRAISKEALEMACEHIIGNDFPDQISDLFEKASAVGFQTSSQVSNYCQHAMLSFEKTMIQ
ncbi:class I SAM-dependent methyltransferase [Nitrosomonas sp.]|uniref:class I SAM-dependent methyltransferase n=1 Tax=Nitrosomonas sp. TaxID=42353 RepID=UPI001D906303|nr:class I SAM-dependent methyltransferase [Nitrosomonas sp.]MCB1948603.1 methyltransferase domain-containing protein [Nitrosomonas sp.]